MMFLRGFTTIGLLCCLFLQGCSDINDGKAKGTGQNPGFPECDVNSANFELLLEKPIRSDIECAYEKINWLVNNVREEQEEKGNTNILSKENLKLSIENREPEARKVLEYLDLFFDLNRFVLGSEEGLIIEDDFRALRDFLIVFNGEFSKIYKHFAAETRNNETLYNIHYNSLNEILSTLRYIILEAKTADGEDISLKGLLSRHTDTNREINLSELFDLLKVEEEGKSWLFLKKLIIGGDSNVITNTEFLEFLEKEIEDESGKKVGVENKILKVVEVGYNLYRQLKLRFDTPQKRYSFQNANYELAKELIYRECIKNCKSSVLERRVYKEESLVNMMEIARWINYFFAEDLKFSGKTINLLNYDWEIGRIKEIFLGNNSNEITYKDVEKLFDLLSEITDIGDDFSVLFTHNQDLMLDKQQRITEKTPIKNLVKKQKSLLKDSDNYNLFKYVLKTFRYFEGQNRIPIYSSEYHRDNKSIVFYGQFEHLLRKVAKFYERQYPCDKRKIYYIYNFETGKKEPEKLFHDYYCDVGWRKRKEDYAGNVDLGQLYLIILEFRQLFREAGIIEKGKEDSSAENALTIPDLFIYSANDDGKIQVSELLEFFFGIFSAVEIKDDIVSQLRVNSDQNVPKDVYFAKADCQIVDIYKGEPRYDTKCIRDHFYFFLRQKNAKHNDTHFKYLPNLEKFYDKYRSVDPNDTSLTKELRRYTLLLEGYTKSCAYDNVPYSESDIMAVYTGMFSIESTMGKFDLNGDNILNEYTNDAGEKINEVELAYQNHFKPGLWAIVQDFIKGEAEEQDNFKPYDPSKDPWIVRQVFQYLAKHKSLPDEFTWKTLVKGVGVVTGGFPSIGRDGIASILVVLQNLTEPKRKIRYERAGKRYFTPEEKCMKELPPGETKLIRKQQDCLVDGNCS